MVTKLETLRVYSRIIVNETQAYQIIKLLRGDYKHRGLA